MVRYSSVTITVHRGYRTFFASRFLVISTLSKQTMRYIISLLAFFWVLSTSAQSIRETLFESNRIEVVKSTEGDQQDIYAIIIFQNAEYSYVRDLSITIVDSKEELLDVVAVIEETLPYLGGDIKYNSRTVQGLTFSNTRKSLTVTDDEGKFAFWMKKKYAEQYVAKLREAAEFLE